MFTLKHDFQTIREKRDELKGKNYMLKIALTVSLLANLTLLLIVCN